MITDPWRRKTAEGVRECLPILSVAGQGRRPLRTFWPTDANVSKK